MKKKLSYENINRDAKRAIFYKTSFFTFLNILDKESLSDDFIDEIAFFSGELIEYFIKEKKNFFEIEFSDDEIENWKYNRHFQDYVISALLQIFLVATFSDNKRLLKSFTDVSLTYALTTLLL